MIFYPLSQILESIQSEGFAWAKFQEVFPFGFLGIREGEYQSLVEAVVDSFDSAKEKTRLLDLLDMQWHVFCEQLAEAHDQSGDDGLFAGELHFAEARNQINENVRRSRGIEIKDMRKPMYEFRKLGKTLLDLCTE